MVFHRPALPKEKADRGEREEEKVGGKEGRRAERQRSAAFLALVPSPACSFRGLSHLFQDDCFFSLPSLSSFSPSFFFYVLYSGTPLRFLNPLLSLDLFFRVCVCE